MDTMTTKETKKQVITTSQVEHVALLARLELNEAEKDIYVNQLNNILAYMQMLNELDTENVTPTAHVLPLCNVFRQDEAGRHMPVEKVLANAPEKEEQFFKVPRIV